MRIESENPLDREVPRNVFNVAAAEFLAARVGRVRGNRVELVIVGEVRRGVRLLQGADALEELLAQFLARVVGLTIARGVKVTVAPKDDDNDRRIITPDEIARGG